MDTNIFDGYIAERDYAEQRGVSVRWLRQERQTLQGPPFTKVGGSIYYPVDGIRDWLRANTVNTLPAVSDAAVANESIEK